MSQHQVVGTSVVEFFTRFPNEDACLEQLVRSRWGDHTPCPKCGEIGRWKRVNGSKTYRHSCRQKFSPTVNTLFYHSRLSLMAWFYAMHLFGNATSGVRSSFIRKQLGIGVTSAHRLCNSIRTHLSAQKRPRMLGGTGKNVHVDEVYLRHVVGGGKGRHEIAIVMGIECEGQVLSGRIKNKRASTVIPAIEKRVRPGSIIITDAMASYKALSGRGWKHHAIDHAKGFYDKKGRSTNPIELYWATVRRYCRLYRQMNEANFWRYLGEIEFSYNRRKSNTSKFDEMVSFFPELTPENEAKIRARYTWD